MTELLGSLGGGLSDDLEFEETERYCQEATAACSGNDPCQAAWQCTYEYYADKQFDQAKYQALLGLAFGVLQYASADRTADLQYDIANRQMLIAEEEYQRYKDTWIECEEAYVTEVCAIEVCEVDYDLYADRAERDVRKKFSIAREKIYRTRSRYCVSDTLYKLCEMEKAESLAAIATRDNAYRYAEQRRDYYDNIRHDRRMTVINLGRSVMTGQANIYQAASGQAIAALSAGNLGRQNALGTIFGAASGLLNAYGATQISPFPYGTGYTGSGATSIGTPTARPPTNVSGFPSAGGGPYAG